MINYTILSVRCNDKIFRIISSVVLATLEVMEQVHGARVFYNREITKVDPNTLLDKIKKEISDLGLSRSKRFRSNIPSM